jgi:hypothetical protein
MGGSCSARGGMINAYNILLERLKGRDQSEDMGLNGRSILQ